MLAVISDIHGNIEAFRAVMDDVEQAGAERILCLGDLVGYGPDPLACLTLARERCDVVLRGNHDMAVITQALGFNTAAREVIDWTRERIKPAWYSGPARRAGWRLLKEAPLRHEEDGALFVHASPRDPMMEYIEQKDVENFGFGPTRKIEAIMSIVTGLVYIGHTHNPGIIGPERKWHAPDDLPEGWPRDRVPAIVNVGSVGQPRDRNPRACYVLVDDTRVRYRRVPYDFETTQRKMRAIGTLDSRLADRLEHGA